MMKKNILIIGKSNGFGLIVSAILENKYTIHNVESFSDAIRVVESEFINLIISPLNLHKESCFSFAAKLNDVDELRKAPIVLASNIIDTSIIVESQQCGILDILKLPLELTEFEQRIDSVIHKYTRSLEKPDNITGFHKKLYAEERISGLLQDNKNGALLLVEVCQYSFANSNVHPDLIKSISDVLKGLVSENAITSVAASSDFMIFEPSLRTREKIESYASSIINALNKNEETKKLFVSIGLAATDRHGSNFKDLYHMCSMGLGLARQGGRNKACFYKW